MSERDNSSIGCVAIFVTVALIILTVWLRADYNEIRDLQRRVGQLESEKR
jgi:hypothetical protein